MGEKAVFLNRDHTLIQANGIIDSPEKVTLAPSVPTLLRRLREADYRIVVVTNQPGVARGQFDEDTLVAIHERIQELLSEHSAPLDAIYYCPFLDTDEATVAQYRVDSNLRKPQPGMQLQAAADLDLDLTASWMIGRSGDDMQSGLAAGCKTILLDANGKDEANGKGKPSEANHVVKNLRQAVDLICGVEPIKAAPSQPGEASTENLLAEIRDLLRTQQRLAEREDFSLAQLGAAVAQMLAMALAFWGLMDIADPQNGYPMVVGRFLAAIFAQLVAMTLFGRRP